MVSNHPGEEFNGEYKWIDQWNDQPHFLNANGKHLYFYDPGQDESEKYAWNMDGRDQSDLSFPGMNQWFDGG